MASYCTMCRSNDAKLVLVCTSVDEKGDHGVCEGCISTFIVKGFATTNPDLDQTSVRIRCYTCENNNETVLYELDDILEQLHMYDVKNQTEFSLLAMKKHSVLLSQLVNVRLHNIQTSLAPALENNNNTNNNTKNGDNDNQTVVQMDCEAQHQANPENEQKQQQLLSHPSLLFPKLYQLLINYKRAPKDTDQKKEAMKLLVACTNAIYERDLQPMISTLTCPVCNVLLPDNYDACNALRCPTCGIAFCGICWTGQGLDAHAHIRAHHPNDLFTTTLTILQDRLEGFKTDRLYYYLSQNIRHPFLIYLLLLRFIPDYMDNLKDVKKCLNLLNERGIAKYTSDLVFSTSDNATFIAEFVIATRYAWQELDLFNKCNQETQDICILFNLSLPLSTDIRFQITKNLFLYLFNVELLNIEKQITCLSTIYILSEFCNNCLCFIQNNFANGRHSLQFLLPMRETEFYEMVRYVYCLMCHALTLRNIPANLFYPFTVSYIDLLLQFEKICRFTANLTQQYRRIFAFDIWKIATCCVRNRFLEETKDFSFAGVYLFALTGRDYNNNNIFQDCQFMAQSIFHLASRQRSFNVHEKDTAIHAAFAQNFFTAHKFLFRKRQLYQNAFEQSFTGSFQSNDTILTLVTWIYHYFTIIMKDLLVDRKAKSEKEQMHFLTTTEITCSFLIFLLVLCRKQCPHVRVLKDAPFRTNQLLIELEKALSSNFKLPTTFPSCAFSFTGKVLIYAAKLFYQSQLDAPILVKEFCRKFRAIHSASLFEYNLTTTTKLHLNVQYAWELNKIKTMNSLTWNNRLKFFFLTESMRILFIKKYEICPKDVDNWLHDLRLQTTIDENSKNDESTQLAYTPGDGLLKIVQAQILPWIKIVLVNPSLNLSNIINCICKFLFFIHHATSLSVLSSSNSSSSNASLKDWSQQCVQDILLLVCNLTECEFVAILQHNTAAKDLILQVLQVMSSFSSPHDKMDSNTINKISWWFDPVSSNNTCVKEFKETVFLKGIVNAFPRTHFNFLELIQIPGKLSNQLITQEYPTLAEKYNMLLHLEPTIFANLQHLHRSSGNHSILFRPSCYLIDENKNPEIQWLFLRICGIENQVTMDRTFIDNFWRTAIRNFNSPARILLYPIESEIDMLLDSNANNMPNVKRLHILFLTHLEFFRLPDDPCCLLFFLEDKNVERNASSTHIAQLFLVGYDLLSNDSRQKWTKWLYEHLFIGLQEFDLNAFPFRLNHFCATDMNECVWCQHMTNGLMKFLQDSQQIIGDKLKLSVQWETVGKNYYYLLPFILPFVNIQINQQPNFDSSDSSHGLDLLHLNRIFSGSLYSKISVAEKISTTSSLNMSMKVIQALHRVILSLQSLNRSRISITYFLSEWKSDFVPSITSVLEMFVIQNFLHVFAVQRIPINDPQLFTMVKDLVQFFLHDAPLSKEFLPTKRRQPHYHWISLCEMILQIVHYIRRLNTLEGNNLLLPLITIWSNYHKNIQGASDFTYFLKQTKRELGTHKYPAFIQETHISLEWLKDEQHSILFQSNACVASFLDSELCCPIRARKKSTVSRRNNKRRITYSTDEENIDLTDEEETDLTDEEETNRSNNCNKSNKTSKIV